MELLIEFFAKLHDLDALIRWGGYLVLALIVFAETGLLVGFFLPGDSLLVTAGLFAGTGDLSIGVLFFLLAAMAIVGDAVGYWIGRVSGPRIFNRDKSVLFAKDHLLVAKAFYEKHGGKTIILARFMPIVRTFAPVVAGVANMPYGRFAAYNIVGGIAWVGSMLFIGYFLGRTIPDIESKIHYVIAIVILLSISPGVIELIRHRRKKSRA
jgi:membrane-associated protein